MTWPDHRRQMVLLWLLCAAGGAFVLVRDILPVQPFWDLRLYDAAAAMARAGADPYAQGFGRSDLRFVYPPLVLTLFAALGPALVPALAAVYAACAGAFLVLAPPSLRLAPVLVLGVFAFIHDPLSSAIVTGNLSLYLHLLILALWLHADGPRRRRVLLAVIVVAACIKPTFAAYFALWALRDLRPGRESAEAGAALLVAGAVWILQAVLMPEAFAAFVAALRDQSGLGGGKLDMGLGAFPAVLRLTGSPAAAMAAHLAAWALCVAAWAGWLRGPLTARNTAAARQLCLTAPVILCVALNPRLKSYEVATIFLLAVHAGHLWGRLRPGPPVLPLLALFAAVQINDPIGPTHVQMGVEALIVLLFYALAARAIGRRQTA